MEEPVTLMPYAYAWHNPITYRDPSGRSPAFGCPPDSETAECVRTRPASFIPHPFVINRTDILDDCTNPDRPSALQHDCYDTRDPGQRKIRGIVLHDTATPVSRTCLNIIVDWARRTHDNRASAHYVIDVAGWIVQAVRDKDVAYHAGYSRASFDMRINPGEHPSRYVERTFDGLNEITLGIEVINPGGHHQPSDYFFAQRNALVRLVRSLAQKYDIPSTNIFSHEEIRKNWIDTYPKQAQEKEVSGKLDGESLKQVVRQAVLADRLAQGLGR